MKEQDRARFTANIRWLNQFFDGVRTIYEMVENQLPTEFFPAIATLTSDNFYFFRQKVVPSIPPYYALYRQGFKHALQILTIIDQNLIRIMTSLPANHQSLSCCILDLIRVPGWMNLH